MVSVINVEAIASALKTGMVEQANSKMVRYFMQGDPDTKFMDKVRGYSNTLAVLIAKSETSSISVDDETFNITDYKLTKGMQALVDAGKLFVAKDTEGCVEPWFSVELSSDLTNIWTPSKFNRFLEEYSSYLSENKTAIADLRRRTTFQSLCDLKAFLSTDGKSLCVLNSEGSIPEEAAQLLNITNPGFAENTLKTVVLYNERGLGRWLLQ